MKKTLVFFGIALLATVAFFGNNTSNSSQGFTLESLVKLNSANAECIPHWGDPNLNFGTCLPVNQICIFSTGTGNCDPYAH